MKTSRIVCALLFALVLISSQAVRAEDTAVTLVRKFKKDTVTHSEVSIRSSIMGMEIHIKGKSKETVKEVKANGDVVVESTDESGTIKVGEMPEQELPISPPTVETRDKHGKLLEY